MTQSSANTIDMLTKNIQYDDHHTIFTRTREYQMGTDDVAYVCLKKLMIYSG